MFNYDNIADFRYNPFKSNPNDRYIPKMIGYGANPVETYTIDANGQISLFEFIQDNATSKTWARDATTGEVLSETTSSTPAKNQFSVCYEELGNGIVQFHSSRIDHSVQMKYYGLGTRPQRSTLKFQILGSTATKLVASSDSSAGSQEIANEIILTSEDAGIKINELIAELNTLSGGEIKFLEGTYNISTTIVGKENIVMTGSGDNTIFNNYAYYMMNLTNVENIIIRNMKLKFNAGMHAFFWSTNGGTYKGRKFQNIYAEAYDSLGNSPTYIFMDGVATNCIVIGNSAGSGSSILAFYNCDYSSNCYVTYCRTGFSGCNYIRGCSVVDQKQSGFPSYSGCQYSSNCYAYNGSGIGFDSCDNLTGSFAIGNSNYGIYNSDNISSCTSNSNTYGYVTCNNVSVCKAQSNSTDGFFNCDNVSSCFSNSNTADGFQDCENVMISESLNNVNGFDGCLAIGFNYSHGNSGSAYNASFADRAGTQAADDSSVGGYNG
jgi:hypothetical protein